MDTFVTILHICVALSLIALVLVQDSKSGSAGGAFGGGGSSSVLGATGAATLAQKLTSIMAAIFACTCIALSMFSARSQHSVMDSVPSTAAAPAPVDAAPGAAAATPAANPATTPAAATPVAPAEAAPAK